MASIDEVAGLLRHLRNSTVAINDDGDFLVSIGRAEAVLAATDVDNYLAVRNGLQRPVQPAVCVTGYFEQAVELQGRTPFSMRLFRERDDIVIEDASQGRTVTLSPASTTFALAQLDGEVPRELRRMISFGRDRLGRLYPVGEQCPFSAILGRILTVKVHTRDDDVLATNCRKLQALAEAALFHVAFGLGVGISLQLDWERAYYRLGLRRDAEIQFPRRTYTSELLAYYQLAFGSDSLMLAYLSLYKVLEYFFTSSSKRILHQKMIESLVQPDFATTKPKKLDELARVVRLHDTKLDEERQLKTVLEDHFGPDVLRAWIEDFDRENDSYLTTERTIFAKLMRVDVSDNQLFPTVACRIYHIRNALVHHKEGEVSRFVPFSGQEAVLHRELPLLLYIAEQLIIKTGKDLN